MNDPVRVVAVSTGTSVDALDVVAVEVRCVADTLEVTVLGTREVMIAPPLRAAVLDLLPPATTTTAAVCRVDADLGRAFAAAANDAVDDLADGRADLVTVLGQTVHHEVVDGQVRGTLQLGQPAFVAEATGLPVVADLRTRDVAAGGQGAPLVSYLDVLLLRATSPSTPVALANLGGIANLTVVAPDRDPIAFDVGPANALLDAEARRSLGRDRDEDGVVAASGTVDPSLLGVLLDDPFLAAPPPRSTGKERYHLGWLDAALRRAPVAAPADRLATLTEAVAIAVADQAARHDVGHLWASGGGVANVHLAGRLAARLGERGCGYATTAELGLAPAAKEAVAIAVLGWASWLGTPATMPSCTGAVGPRILGSLTPGRDPLRLPPPLATAPMRATVWPRVPEVIR